MQIWKVQFSKKQLSLVGLIVITLCFYAYSYTLLETVVSGARGLTELFDDGLFPLPDETLDMKDVPLSTKTISFGTYLFDTTLPWFNVDKYGQDLKCSKSCMLVKDPAKADGLMFVIWSLITKSDNAIKALKQRREENPNQKYMLFTSESPAWLPWMEVISSDRYRTTLSTLNGYFNVMGSYQDGDLKGIYHYGGSRKQTVEEMQYTKDVGHSIHLSEKEYLATAMISNCNDISGRLAFINEMTKHIRSAGKVIKLYGKCFSTAGFSISGYSITGRRCDGGGTEGCSFNSFAKQFKFYLAFENSRCRDYITEKFWRNALTNDMVPIVNGGLSREDYEKVAPPNSFIHTDDWPSPQALVKYLLYLDTNDTAYNEYFTWKKTHVLFGSHSVIPGKSYVNRYYCKEHPETCADRSDYCEFCNFLHNDSINYHHIWNLHERLGIKENCRGPSSTNEDYLYT